ncbi:MAG: CotH kinase family protein [Paludibacteraceae bacterium]|nr:CotH kinase family protein [Paludibacteraceae bacterium]
MKESAVLRLIHIPVTVSVVLLGLCTACKKELPVSVPVSITSFGVTDNKATVVVSDSDIFIQMPRGRSLETIVPVFETEPQDAVLMMEGDTLYSGISTIDLRTSSTLTVSQRGGNSRKDYRIWASEFTNLPKIYIQLASGNEVQSKTNMQKATFTFEGNGNFENFDRVQVKGMIRGRGNSTWGFPKKPYKIRLEHATGIFEQKAHRDWVLLANYADKTLIRNLLAFKMSRAMEMPYTPYSQFVELYLNGVHQGNYQLTDQIEIGQGRVIASSIIEMDMRAPEEGIEGVDYFRTDRCPHPWEIEDLGTSTVAQLKQDMNRAESVAFGSNFASETKGWRTVFDEETLIRWSLINELFKNCDANQCSVYFYQTTPGGKFYKGPVWDFDLGAGNAGHASTCQNPEGTYVFEGYLIKRLRNDAKFNQRVKEIWAKYRTDIRSIIEHADDEAESMQLSIEKNFKRWPVFNDNDWYSVPNLPDNYDGQLQYMKNFLLSRFQWMDRQFQ